MLTQTSQIKIDISRLGGIARLGHVLKAGMQNSLYRYFTLSGF